MAAILSRPQCVKFEWPVVHSWITWSASFTRFEKKTGTFTRLNLFRSRTLCDTFADTFHHMLFIMCNYIDPCEATGGRGWGICGGVLLIMSGTTCLLWWRATDDIWANSLKHRMLLHASFLTSGFRRLLFIVFVVWRPITVSEVAKR